MQPAIGEPDARNRPSDPSLAPDAHIAGAAQRIVLLLHDLSGGGTEHVAVRLANCWAADGRQVTLFCGSARGPLVDRLAANVTLVAADPACGRSLTARARLARQLAQFVARHPQDLVFAPGNSHLAVLLLFSQLAPRVATVCKISNPLLKGSERPLRRLIKIGYLTWASRRLTALVAMSPSQHRAARALLPNATLAMAWEPILADRPILPRSVPSRPLVLAIGRLEDQKNFELALRAFAELRRLRDARLIILGDGRRRAALEQLAAQLGIADDVAMPGHQPAVEPYLACASLLLMTSRFEGYPAALVEAMAMSVPVVTTPCSDAVVEIIADCRTSRIVPADPARLAAAMQEVIATEGAIPMIDQPDLVLRHRVSRAGLAYLDVLDAAVSGAARR